MGGKIFKLKQCVWNTCLKTGLNLSLVVPPLLSAMVAQYDCISNWMPVRSKSTVTKFHDASWCIACTSCTSRCCCPGRKRFFKPEAASASCMHESECNHVHTQCLSILLSHLAPLKTSGLPLVTGAFPSASRATSA